MTTAALTCLAICYGTLVALIAALLWLPWQVY